MRNVAGNHCQLSKKNRLKIREDSFEMDVAHMKGTKLKNKRLELLGLTTLENRRFRADTLEVFKILKGFERTREDSFLGFCVQELEDIL